MLLEIMMNTPPPSKKTIHYLTSTMMQERGTERAGAGLHPSPFESIYAFARDRLGSVPTTYSFRPNNNEEALATEKKKLQCGRSEYSSVVVQSSIRSVQTLPFVS